MKPDQRWSRLCRLDICQNVARMKTRRWTLNVFAFMLDTARTNAKTIVKENTSTKPLSIFQLTWKLRKSLVRSYIQRRHDSPVGLTHSLVKSICKVLGIEQPTEWRQKPELSNKGQRCYLCLEEINGQPDYKANKDKLNNKVKTVCISCKNTTCIKHFITTCDRCFEGSDEWFYFLVFLRVVYSQKSSNCFENCLLINPSITTEFT